MEKLSVRLLPDRHADGPTQMAVDEVMLQSASNGIASLRFYTWTTPTLSLGYFQPQAGRLDDLLLAELPFVRRSTGGHAIVHHHELTYALALPAGDPWKKGRECLPIHEIIATALGQFGVKAVPHVCNDPDNSKSYLCFHHITSGDLVIDGVKVVGSAQLRRHGAILQHGSILLVQSPSTPTLPGVRELTDIDIGLPDLRGAILAELQQRLGWRLETGDWTGDEAKVISDTQEKRYRADTWNRKR